jgi:hypothetical protein
MSGGDINFWSLFTGGGSGTGGGGGRRPPAPPAAPASPADSAKAASARTSIESLRRTYEAQQQAARTKATRLRAAAKDAAMQGQEALALQYLGQAKAEEARADGITQKLVGLGGKERLLDRTQGAVREAEVTGMVHMAMDELTEHLDASTLAELHEDLNGHAATIDEIDEQFTAPVGVPVGDLRRSEQDRTADLRSELASLMTHELESIPIMPSFPSVTSAPMGVAARRIAVPDGAPLPSPSPPGSPSLVATTRAAAPVPTAVPTPAPADPARAAMAARLRAARTPSQQLQGRGSSSGSGSSSMTF